MRVDMGKEADMKAALIVYAEFISQVMRLSASASSTVAIPECVSDIQATDAHKDESRFG